MVDDPSGKPKQMPADGAAHGEPPPGVTGEMMYPPVEVMSEHGAGPPSGVGGEIPGGEMSEAACFEVPDGELHLGVPAVVFVGFGQRMIAQLFRMPVGGALFGFTRHLTDRRVHIYRHRPVACGTGQLPAPAQSLAPCLAPTDGRGPTSTNAETFSNVEGAITRNPSTLLVDADRGLWYFAAMRNQEPGAGESSWIRRLSGRGGGMALWIASAAAAGVLALAAGAGAQDGYTDDGGIHQPAIEALDGEGILEGTECGEGRFCPGEPFLRRVMGVWLVRALDESPSAADTRFADLDSAVWWTPYVERLAELNVTQGCGAAPVRYCPDQPVTRGQMATFLTRAFGLEDGPPAGFTDTAGHRHAAAVNALAAARITAGCGEGRYCPDQPVTRGQMATFLARALDLTARPEAPASDSAPSRELRFTAVAVGASHSCGIRLNFNSTVACWGGNSSGQADAPTGHFTAIATGAYHSCGVRLNKTITCWGDNASGQADAPTGQFTAITAGDHHSCGIRTDSTIACWGTNGLSEKMEAPTGQFTTITTGQDHTCGIRTDKTVTCWGSELFGRTTPSEQFTAITAGYNHTCGIRLDATVACWVSNNGGQSTPPPSEQFTAITAGYDHSCGIRTDKTVTCWGSNYYGQITPPSEQFTAITAGGAVSCGIRTNNTITCWGNNESGRIEAPTGQFATITTGDDHSCGIRTNNTITCWGSNSYGQTTPTSIGEFTTITRECGIRTDRTVTCWLGSRWSSLITQPPPGQFTSITTGEIHSCGIRTNGTITCWDYIRRSTERPIPTGQFTAITAGSGYTCGIRTHGTVICWGSNYYYNYGQTNAPPGQFITITTSYDHTCGIHTSNLVFCWGNNSHGQVNAPPDNFTAITTGGGYTCGIRINATVTCWGNNWNGEIDAPTGEFTAITTWGYIGLENYRGHSCGIRTNGTVTCWGDNSFGQAEAPTGQFTAITTGISHSCGIQPNSTITCWGNNESGQTETPTGQFTAITAGKFHTCGIRTNGTVTCWGDTKIDYLEGHDEGLP